MGLGAACLLGSGAAAWSAWQGDRDADPYRVSGSSRFDPTKISEAAAVTRIDSINTGRGLAIGLALVGSAATAVGAWIWRTHHDTSTTTQAVR